MSLIHPGRHLMGVVKIAYVLESDINHIGYYRVHVFESYDEILDTYNYIDAEANVLAVRLMPR